MMGEFGKAGHLEWYLDSFIRDPFSINVDLKSVLNPICSNGGFDLLHRGVCQVTNNLIMMFYFSIWSDYKIHLAKVLWLGSMQVHKQRMHWSGLQGTQIFWLDEDQWQTICGRLSRHMWSHTTMGPANICLNTSLPWKGSHDGKHPWGSLQQHASISQSDPCQDNVYQQRISQKAKHLSGCEVLFDRWLMEDSAVCQSFRWLHATCQQVVWQFGFWYTEWFPPDPCIFFDWNRDVFTWKKHLNTCDFIHPLLCGCPNPWFGDTYHQLRVVARLRVLIHA